MEEGFPGTGNQLRSSSLNRLISSSRFFEKKNVFLFFFFLIEDKRNFYQQFLSRYDDYLLNFESWTFRISEFS